MDTCITERQVNVMSQSILTIVVTSLQLMFSTYVAIATLFVDFKFR